MDKTLGNTIDKNLKKAESMKSFKIIYQENRDEKTFHPYRKRKYRR